MNRLIALCLFLAFVTFAVPVTAQEKEKPVKASASAPAPGSVNLNSASQAQLEKLPGIGPAAAKRIIEYRDKNGGFKKIEELMNVKGIGEKSFLKLKSMLTVGAAATK